MGRMRTIELGGTRIHLAGGPNDDGLGPQPLVVLFHGYGAPGTDLVSLRTCLDNPPALTFAFPEAWLVVPEAGSSSQPGRAWWPIDMVSLQVNLWLSNTDRVEELLRDGLESALERANSLITELSHYLGRPREQIVVGGFSQGAILALELALTSPTLGGLVSLSGGSQASRAVCERAAKVGPHTAFIAHGEDDPVLPFAGSRALKQELEEAGWQVHWNPFHGGHTIGPMVLAELSRFLRDRKMRSSDT